MLHPKVEGLNIPGFVSYTQDLDELKNIIDYWLDDAQAEERKIRMLQGHEHVKKYDTYTNRAQEIIDTVFGSNDD